MGFGFGEEQVDVFRHEHIAEDVELVPNAKFFELIEEGGSCGIVVKVGKTSITTEGDEVPGSVRLMTLQG